MFDEPSSYLDVKQRLKAAQVIRSLLRPNRLEPLSLSKSAWNLSISSVLCWITSQDKYWVCLLFTFSSYVIVVEHDLSVLDYLSDFICCLYGKPGAYGVVTLPFSVREGINIFLAGFVPTENLRFRDDSLTFKVYIIYASPFLSFSDHKPNLGDENENIQHWNLVVFVLTCQKYNWVKSWKIFIIWEVTEYPATISCSVTVAFFILLDAHTFSTLKQKYFQTS